MPAAPRPAIPQPSRLLARAAGGRMIIIETSSVEPRARDIDRPPRLSRSGSDTHYVGAQSPHGKLLVLVHGSLTGHDALAATAHPRQFPCPSSSFGRSSTACSQGAVTRCTATFRTLAVQRFAGPRPRSKSPSARGSPTRSLTHRGFLPWRFSYAGPRSCRSHRHGPAPKPSQNRKSSERANYFSFLGCKRQNRSLPICSFNQYTALMCGATHCGNSGVMTGALRGLRCHLIYIPDDVLTLDRVSCCRSSA